jgi:glycosyltransferase involved in cell wall biosynthesis
VLLSTYNGEAYLAAQLDSLAAQKDVDVEVFVRDDGSTDGTLAILARHADRWPALAAPMTGPNLGPARSFLALLAAAPGDFDYYAFCDQDDVWLPEKLGRASRRLAQEGGAPALYCARVLCVDAQLRPLGERWIGGDASFEHLLFENIAFGTTLVMNAPARSGIVAQTPGPGLIMHDWWCALWASAFGVIVRDDRATILYRQHGSNAVGSSPNWLNETSARLRGLLRDPGAFYPIHAQAEEFLRLHGDRLSPARRSLASKLVASRGSVRKRLAYAMFGTVVRSGIIKGLVARALIALDLY